MKSAFVILTHNASTAQQTAIGEAFKHLGWWHYLPQAWIIADPSGELTVASVRDIVRVFAPGLRHFVFKIDTDNSPSWAGYAPPSMTKWLKSQLKKDGGELE